MIDKPLKNKTFYNNLCNLTNTNEIPPLILELRGTYLMKKLFMLFAIVSVFFSCSYGQQVEIPDENLAAAIRQNLGLRPDTPITGWDLRKLKTLSAPQKGIKDLRGLEKANSLTTLELYDNEISDISPLAGLKKLRKLTLSANQITDISPLAGLTLLNYLGLEQNRISDITLIENLKNLKFLFINKNPINNLGLVEKLQIKNKELNTQTIPFSSDVNQYETNSGLPYGAIARFGKGGINVMHFSPDGTQLAVGTDIGVWVYDSASGEEKHLPANTFGQSNALAFSPNGRILASGGSSNSEIQLWDMKTGDQLLHIPLPISVHSHLMNKKDETHVKSVAALAFSHDGRTLLSISFTGLINYWDVASGKKLSEHHGKLPDGQMTLSQDGSSYACGYSDGEIWAADPSTGERVATIKGHSSSFNKTKYRRIRSLAFSPDGNSLASGSEDKKVQLYSTPISTNVQHLKDI